MATTHARLIWAVLLAFALRALIPLGFMPAGDGTLSLMICPGGLPPGVLPAMDKAMPMSGGMPMPPQHHGHGSAEQSYCAFTTGFSSAPPPLLLAKLLLLFTLTALIAVAVLAPAGIRLVHLPQARAPPARC